MKHHIIALAAAVIAVALAACEAETPRTITVTAAGTAEGEATHFALDVAFTVEADTRAEAAREAERVFTALRDGLPELAGLDEITLQTSNFQVQPICVGDQTRRYSNIPLACDTLTYLAGQSVRVTGAPAEEAGNAASLANELGADRAEIRGYTTSLNSELRTQALAAAAMQARTRAEGLAAAVGAELGAIQSVRPETIGRGSVDFSVNDPDAIRVTGARLPEIAMSVEPGPVAVNEQLTFVFELVDAPASADE